MAYALAQRTHTYSFFLSFSLFLSASLTPSSTQTGHCVRAQMRFACMLDWITHAGSGNLDPCGLPSLFRPETGKLSLSIHNFKRISQFNWLWNIQNQRLDSLDFGRVGICVQINFMKPWLHHTHTHTHTPQTSIRILHPSVVRFITWGRWECAKGLILWVICIMRILNPWSEDAASKRVEITDKSRQISLKIDASRCNKHLMNWF